jgi:hypothetical protein
VVFILIAYTIFVPNVIKTKKPNQKMTEFLCY